MDCSQLDRLIDDLADFNADARHGRCKWRDAWPRIKEISSAFRGTRYPTHEKHSEAWQRFQDLIAEVKAAQQQLREDFDKRAANSAGHKNRIIAYAEAAYPSAVATTVFEIVTGAFIIRPVLDAVLGGQSDPWRETLQQCSAALKAGWQYLSDWKREIFRSDADEAVQALRKAQALLNEEWAKYKGARHAAYEARQQGRREREEKRAAFRERVHTRVENHESRIERLQEVLAHKRNHLDDLYDKRASARSDSFRDRVDEWIREEQESISDIEDKIDRLRRWIEEERSRL